MEKHNCGKERDEGLVFANGKWYLACESQHWVEVMHCPWCGEKLPVATWEWYVDGQKCGAMAVTCPDTPLNLNEGIPIPEDAREREVPTMFVPGNKLRIEFSDGHIIEVCVKDGE